MSTTQKDVPKKGDFVELQGYVGAKTSNLDKEKSDALLQDAKYRKEKMAIEKLAGRLIPIDLAMEVIQVFNRAIYATFQSEMENIASIYCDILANSDRKKLSEITDVLSEKLVRRNPLLFLYKTVVANDKTT